MAFPADQVSPSFSPSSAGCATPQRLPDLSVDQILAWADAFRAQQLLAEADFRPHPRGPGRVVAVRGSALQKGLRGFPGGSRISKLLAEHRVWRYPSRRPALTVPQILAWADAFRARTGRWPKRESGPIREAPGETWFAVHRALQTGRRGLPGGSSLPRLLKGD